MSVYQLKDGRWVVQYRDKDNPGKYKRKYFGRGLDGEKKAREHEDSIGKREYIKNAEENVLSPVFTELVNAYLTARRGHIQPSTWDSMLYKFRGVILPEIGNTEVYRLTHYRMDQYVAKRLLKVKRTTVHRELSDIMAVLNWAMKRELITRNPLYGYEKPARDDDIITPATPGEVKRIIENAAPHLVRALTVSYYTGLRPGLSELLRLRWEDINWDDGLILVRSAKKGGLKSRLVPMHHDFAATLQRWQKEDGDNAEYIITFKGKPVDSLKTAWIKAKRRAKIKRRIRMYDIRHAAITSMLTDGADLRSVSEIAGHSRPDTTVRIYSHATGATHRAAINRISSLGIAETTLGTTDTTECCTTHDNGKLNE